MSARPSQATYDVAIVGGGHNGLTAAAYLARAGRSVLVLERLGQLGGAAVSERPFAGVDARLSRYAYLVSLLPAQIISELGLRVELRRRRISSYTPVPGAPERGLLIDNADAGATRAAMTAISGDAGAFDTWTAFYARMQRVAARVFPTVLEPLRTREQMRAIAADDEAWRMLFEQPIAETIEATFGDDTLRGIVLTDALIGTFSRAADADLRQNRCFLYHVIGNGTGDWDVPVGGMGAVTAALEHAASAAGAELLADADVAGLGLRAGGVDVDVRPRDGEAYSVSASHVLANVAPATLARLLGEPDGDPPPQGAQLKVNMLLRRLPRLREAGADPRQAFAGTFHINEGYAQLDAAYVQAAAGAIPDLPPCEIYCHSLTDDSILGPELAAAGAQTLTLFGLHMPADLFRADNDAARESAMRATLCSLDSVLGEPIEDCLWQDRDGRPCIEARTPLDLERELGLPAGNIFHADLQWPFAESADEAGRWGVESEHERVLLCGAGARRGGGVSGIPGRAAAMALLGRGGQAPR